MKNGISRKHFNEQMDLVCALMEGYRLCKFDEINSSSMYSRLIVISNSVRLLANEIRYANDLKGGLYD